VSQKWWFAKGFCIDGNFKCVFFLLPTLYLRALFACESGLSELEIGLEHAFVLLIWQKKQEDVISLASK
jgi:hypothetical protein